MNDMPASPSDGDSPTGSDSSASSASPASSAPADSHGAGSTRRDSQQDPQYGPQPGPTPSFQQYGGPQPGPQGGSTHRFFDSLRGSGLMRTNERWIAGVAGGVAYRFGLDPTLVRCVWVVLSLFAGVGLVLYGLAWALLPEESDGRIHLEEALSGRFNAGLAGAIGMTIIGMSTFGSGFIPNWYVHEAGTAGIAAALWPLFWLGLIVLAIVFLIRSAQNRSANRKAARGHRGPQPWQTYPAGAAQAPGSRPGSQAGPAGQAGNFASAAGPASAWHSSAPGSGGPAFSQPAGGPSWQSRSYRQYPSYQQPPVPTRPARRPRRPGLGYRGPVVRPRGFDSLDGVDHLDDLDGLSRGLPRRELARPLDPGPRHGGRGRDPDPAHCGSLAPGRRPLRPLSRTLRVSSRPVHRRRPRGGRLERGLPQVLRLDGPHRRRSSGPLTGEIGQLVLQIRNPTTLAQIERGRGARGATAGPDRYQQKSTGNGETPPGQGRESAHHDETEQDSQESAGDGGAMGGGDAATLPRLAMGLTRTDQLALGAQRSHVPHCGPVHGLDLRSTSKDLRAPAADAGLIGGEGVARGQDPQLGGVAVLGVGQAHHLSTSNQERQKVHGENRHERHQHPDLDSHSSTVCGSGPPR